MVDFSRLTESASWADPINITEFLYDTPGFNIGSAFAHATQIDDRDDGRFRPVYTHEIDCKIIRAMSWLLHERVPMAKAWEQRLLDYTIGTGFDWTITSKDDAKLAKRCKQLVDSTLLQNDWTSEMEAESFEREVVDGECMIQLDWCDGDVAMGFREADELTEPAAKKDLQRWLGCDQHFESSWTFGIHTRRHKPDRPLGYHFVKDAAGTYWDYVPASRVAHWKRNVRKKAKRGVSDFYAPHVYLMKGDKVFTRTAEGTATQASIAYIVKHAPATTSAQASGLLALSRFSGRIDPNTGATERLAPGSSASTRLDIKGMDYYAGPLGTNNSKIYVEVMSAAMQLAGTIRAFPEGMLTGSWGGANFASILVAQSPFVQGRIVDQNRRANRLERLIKQILRLFVEAGALQSEGIDRDCCSDLWRRITIAVIPSNVVPIDRMAAAQALAVQKQNGWVSNKTAMQELGRDVETETANLEEEKAKQPAPMPGVPGAPGVPAAPGQGTAAGGAGSEQSPTPPGSRGESTKPADLSMTESLSPVQRRILDSWGDYP